MAAVGTVAVLVVVVVTDAIGAVSVLTVLIETGVGGDVVPTWLTGAGEATGVFAEGISAAAAGRFSSPTVIPVTESWTGVAES